LKSKKSWVRKKEREIMKVQDLMTSSVKSCRPETNLAAVAVQMWDGDCGVVPVVDEEGKLQGVVTDRDICIAVATKGRRAEEISAGEMMSRQVFSCFPENDPRVALQIMAEHKVHRLPVVDLTGQLLGIISINDMILEAKDIKGKKREGPSYEDVVETLKSICGHREAVVAAA
jgi:CBS domain-containing protein